MIRGAGHDSRVTKLKFKDEDLSVYKEAYEVSCSEDFRSKADMQ